MKKLIVFDMDGTLVDSATDIGEAITHAVCTVCEWPAETITTSLINPLLGKDLHTTFRALLPDNYQERVEECVVAYRTYYLENCSRTTRPYPGLTDLLGELKARGVKLAVATAKYQATIEVVVEKVGLASYFDLVQGVDGFPSKPDPTILKVVMDKLKVEAAATLMIGDTDNDVLCAKRAGVTVCAVSWGGAWSAAQLATLQPDYLVESVAELRQVLNQNLRQVPAVKAGPVL